LKGSTKKALEGVQELKESAPAQAIQKRVSKHSEDKQGLQAAKSVLSELSEKEFKQSDEIIRDLEQVEEVIKRYGDQPKVRSFVSQKLRGVLPKSHALSVEMHRLRELDRHLMRGDYSLYKALQERVSGLEGEERKAFEQRLRGEVQRIRSEWQSEKAEERVQSHQRSLEYSIRRCAQSLTMGRRKDAVRWVRKAIEQEREAEKLLKQVRGAKRKLLKLASHDLREG